MAKRIHTLAFLAFFISLHTPLLGIVLVQCVLAALTVVLIYRIALEITSSRPIALVSAALSALDPMFIYWGGLLMSDVFFAFLTVLSFYFLLRRYFVVVAFVLGLAALARPIALLYFPAYLIFIAYLEYSKHPRDWKGAARTAVAVAVMFALVVSPWFVRNKILFNTWSFTSAGWYDLYVNPVLQFAEAHDFPLPVIDIDKNGDREFRRFSFEYTPLYLQADFSVILRDVPGYLGFQIERAFESLFSDRYRYLVEVMLPSELPTLYARTPAAVFAALLFLGRTFWYCIAALVFLSLLEPKKRGWWIFFAALVGINAAISGGINPGGTDMSRYSIPFFAFFFPFAGIGLRALAQKMAQWRA